MTAGRQEGPLRVVQFLPSIESASGGPVRSTLANCRAAHAADPEIETVLVSTRHGLEPEWEEELRGRLPAGMTLMLFPQVGRHTANVSPALLSWMWRNLSGHHLLVLRALMHPLTSATAWVARRKGLPYLVVPHGTLSEWTFRHRRRLLKRLYFRLVEHRTLEGAAAVRYTSETERREARRLGFEAADTVIPHPFEPEAEREPADRDAEQVLFLARFDPVKGIDVLLDAMVLARKRRPKLRLVLAGSGPECVDREVRSMIQVRGLEDVVELPGFVTGDEKKAMLSRSGVFVLVSERENFGIAAVEALDAGLPVVISAEVDVAPLVEEYEAGFVVERTPEAVSEAILTVLDEPARARSMGQRGRRLVREQFAPSVVGPRVADLYRSAAAPTQ